MGVSGIYDTYWYFPMMFAEGNIDYSVSRYPRSHRSQSEQPKVQTLAILTVCPKSAGALFKCLCWLLLIVRQQFQFLIQSKSRTSMYQLAPPNSAAEIGRRPSKGSKTCTLFYIQQLEGSRLWLSRSTSCKAFVPYSWPCMFYKQDKLLQRKCSWE